ncbi:MAG: hypothetical protein JNK23_08460 [Opitutaceae bacterium]|nr:hypothetical protein [Opitutaceae bacterium]
MQGTLERPNGTLTYLVKAFAPNRPAPELPDAEYILIEWFEAAPKGRKLLVRHAGDVIADIRSKFGGGRKIILQPSNYKTPAEQVRLEFHYQKCGFVYLPTSSTKWWMYWPHD